MLLSQEHLKNIISESISKILLEKMHILNEKLFPLAEYIYNLIDIKIKKEVYNFSYKISNKTILKYYPYNNSSDLFIVVGDNLTDGNMEYKDKHIIVNYNYFYNYDKNTTISFIIHELTHFINDNEGGIKNILISSSTDMVYILLRKLLYYLRDTECNARCSQFGYFLTKEKNIKDLTHYENITKLKQIAKLLEFFESNEENKKILKTESGLTLDYYKKKYKKYNAKIGNIYYLYMKEKKEKFISY